VISRRETDMMPEVSAGHEDVVRELVGAGADVKRTNDKGLTPLYVLIFSTLEYLVDDTAGTTPRRRAASTYARAFRASPSLTSARLADRPLSHRARRRCTCITLLPPAASNNLLGRSTHETKQTSSHCTSMLFLSTDLASCRPDSHRAATTGSTGFVRLLLNPPHDASAPPPKPRLNTGDRMGACRAASSMRIAV
jgi:hypothetical protein